MEGPGGAPRGLAKERQRTHSRSLGPNSDLHSLPISHAQETGTKPKASAVTGQKLRLRSGKCNSQDAAPIPRRTLLHPK